MKCQTTKIKNRIFLHIHCVVFSLLIFLFCSSGANTHNVDSLKNVLASATEDETRVHLLFATGYSEFYHYNYDSAATYYSRTLDLARQLKDKKTEAKTNYYLGEMYLETGDFDLALEHYLKSAEFYSQENNKKALNDTWFGVGLVYKSKGYYDAALSYYNLSLELSKELRDTLAMADAFNNMATAEKNLGHYPEAMQHLSDALKIYQQNKRPIYIFNVLNNIGSVHEKQGSFNKALEYYEESLALARETGDKFYLFAPLTNTASMYATVGNLEKALELFNEALRLAEEINDNVRIADYYIELGRLMQKNGRLETAAKHYQKAFEIADNIENYQAKTSALLNMSEIEMERKNYQQATLLANQALEISNKTNALPQIIEAYQLLYKVKKETGQFEKALEYQRGWVTLKDSIFSIEKTRAIEELEIKYQLNTQIEENERLKSEAASMRQILMQRKKVSILLFLGLVLLAGVISLLIKRVKDRQKMQQQEEAIHHQKMKNLNDKIEYQKRELVSKSMYISEKNTTLENIIEQLEGVSKESIDENTKRRRLKEIIRELKFELRNQNHWAEFETHFNAVHPGFYKNLNEKYPELTVNDRRLSAFLKLKLSTKNISSITGQSVKSIEVARSRLRKKLNLDREDNLFDVLERI